MSDEDIRPDIQAAKDRMNVKFGAGRELKKLTEHLWHDEQVREMTAGNYGGGQGLMVLTDRRLMFIKEGVMKRTSEDFPLDKLSSAQWSSGMATGKITLFASGNKAEITGVNKTDGKRIVDILRARLSAAPTPTAPAATSEGGGSTDPVEQIRGLAELRDAGILSNEEFEAKKTEILGRM
jgi:Bacterial PH domain/Short C-terminal domain